ncbi:EAL domain-containing protein [Marispirochaeta aestuarii]|uniref:putative bifunctional diguanylate cyclase/phosphodiesterase n=1 Tax=Marispirochaeta aestuarii TaxID=1963862 RepID=UPI0029C6654B|nr:EAL domain-containing protein [Marispirochaeta aestuarii]
MPSEKIRRYRRELEDLKSRYQALAETASDVIIQVSQDLRIVYANSQVHGIFKTTPKKIVGRSFAALFPPGEFRRVEDRIRSYFLLSLAERKKRGISNHMELLGETAGNEILPLEISFGVSVSTNQGRIMPCIIRDISERKKTERKLRYLAYHDKLTDLGNRDLFHIYLNEYLNETLRYGERKGALLFLDLDGFKKVNDSLGHHVGDSILVECTHRLHNCLRESDQIFRVENLEMERRKEGVFRFGGDEFVILLPHLHDPREAAVVALKIINDIRRPYSIRENPDLPYISLGVSIGIAIIPDDGSDISLLISNADIAMYRAKERGNTYRFFTPEMNREVTRRLHLEEGLRAAICASQLTLYFQPIHRNGDGIVGFEALVRWVHPGEGLVLPGDFITLAEETGIIVPLGAMVLLKACHMLSHLQRHGCSNMYLSVNISPRQFDDPFFESKVAEALDKYKVDPRGLKLEMTEGVFIRNPVDASLRINDLKTRFPGLTFMIDDFGTGFSSFSYLSKLPVDVIKIDQTFISGLDQEHNRKIVKGIINLVKSLDLDVVAEGVQNLEHVEYLEKHGCYQHQGYYYYKPMTADELLHVLWEQNHHDGEGGCSGWKGTEKENRKRRPKNGSGRSATAAYEGATGTYQGD